MASKFTKATPPKDTAKRLSEWDLVAIIDDPSAGLPTGQSATAGPKPTPSARTLRSARIELRAAEFLKSKGWRILYHDIHIAHVQVDLLALDPGGVLTVVEVKSHSTMVHLTWRQRARLLRVGQCLAAHRPVQIVFAQVSGQDVLLVPVDGLTA